MTDRDPQTIHFFHVLTNRKYLAFLILVSKNALSTMKVFNHIVYKLDPEMVPLLNLNANFSTRNTTVSKITNHEQRAEVMIEHWIQ